MKNNAAALGELCIPVADIIIEFIKWSTYLYGQNENILLEPNKIPIFQPPF